MLTEKYTFEDVIQGLNKVPYVPCPKYSDREFWHSIPKELKEHFIGGAKEYAECEWEVIPVSLFVKFNTEGDRKSFEDLYFKRRNMLGRLFLAELLEGKGEYISSIIDGIWCICEETGWQVSAHNWKYPDDPTKLMPDSQDYIIDLFAAETAAMLSWIYYIMGDKLDETSPMITKRIEYELKRRIMKPYLESTEFWWMGYDPNRVINNWNPWVNSNCMTVFMLVGSDSEKKASALYKAMCSIDKYIESYPDDGACDEGATYWTVGPGSLFTCLDIFKKVTCGKIDIGDEKKIQRMARYIYDVNLSGDKFVNFSDGSALQKVNFSMVYRFAQYSGNSEVMDYSICRFISSLLFGNDFFLRFSEIMPAFVMSPDIKKQTDLQEPKRVYPDMVWYENVQVLIAHQNKNGMGFGFAAKGGHNDEGHNHNDVGNFVLMHNGNWVFVDAGVGVYTKQTFGEDRYKIWTMQSDYHNLPTIGKYSQLSGKKYSAKNVVKLDSDKEISLKVDIAQAYPEESGIIKYERSLRLCKGMESRLILTDEYSIKSSQVVTLNLMTSEKPEVADNTICLGDVKADVFGDAEIKTEKICIQDEKLNNIWGECLYRIQLTNKVCDKGKFHIEVMPYEKE